MDSVNLCVDHNRLVGHRKNFEVTAHTCWGVTFFGLKPRIDVGFGPFPAGSLPIQKGEGSDSPDTSKSQPHSECMW